MPEHGGASAPSLRQVARVAAPVRSQLLEIIREAILMGDYAPGARLIEREICERTGASRASVREVLRQLESESLVVVVPNRGTIVAVITIEEARDIYEVRELLEGVSARRFAESACEDDRKDLAATLDQLREAAAANDSHHALRIKNDFYEILLGGAGNEVIRTTLEGLRRRISILRGASLSEPNRLHETVAEIEALVSAIEAHNPVGAEEASRRHIRNAATAAIAALRARDRRFSGSPPGGRRGTASSAIARKAS